MPLICPSHLWSRTHYYQFAVSERMAFLLLLASQRQFNVNTFVYSHVNPKHWVQVFRLLDAFKFEITYN